MSEELSSHPSFCVSRFDSLIDYCGLLLNKNLLNKKLKICFHIVRGRIKNSHFDMVQHSAFLVEVDENVATEADDNIMAVTSKSQ